MSHDAPKALNFSTIGKSMAKLLVI